MAPLSILSARCYFKSSTQSAASLATGAGGGVGAAAVIAPVPRGWWTADEFPSVHRPHIHPHAHGGVEMLACEVLPPPPPCVRVPPHGLQCSAAGRMSGGGQALKATACLESAAAACSQHALSSQCVGVTSGNNDSFNKAQTFFLVNLWAQSASAPQPLVFWPCMSGHAAALY